MRNTTKTAVRITGVLAEILTQRLTNAMSLESIEVESFSYEKSEAGSLGR
jgi:hypothetical protein